MRLYLSRVNSPDATPVTLPPAELLSIASTGEMAVSLGHAYVGWMGEGTLARASLLGGNPREILEHIRAADWSPDGSELAIVRRVDGLDQLEYPAGTVLHKTAGYIADVRISPDGNLLAFADHPVYSDDLGDLAIVDRAGNKTTLQADFVSIRGLAWAPGGTEIWFTAVHDSNYDLLASDLAGAPASFIGASRASSCSTSPPTAASCSEPNPGSGEPLPIPGLGERDLPLAWTEDGAALYVGGDTVPMQILRLDLATGQRTPWITISPTDTSGLRIVAAAITPNGKYWSLSISKLLTDLYVVDGLL